MPDSAPPPKTWTLRGLTKTRDETRTRVSAAVNGLPVWFDSEDVELEAYAESFAAAFLIPALFSGATLDVEDPLDPGWVASTEQLVPIYAGWWDKVDRYPIRPTTLKPRPPGPVSAVAQCFTGGVDSFYTLLREDHGVDVLFFVHGYDVLLFDRERSRRVREALAAVAAELGLRAVHVRSNLREHPGFRWIMWAYTHGAGLAAAGYAASAAMGRLVIPSSYSTGRARPWGTHEQTDALWSLPERLAVEHGAAPTRLEKVTALVDEPLVHRYLRVCWKNVDAAWNCSACEKCVRTMVTISTVGDLSRFEVFDQSVSLAERIDQMERLSPHIVGVWADDADRHPDPAVRQAIHRLVKRTREGKRTRPARRRWVPPPARP